MLKIIKVRWNQTNVGYNYLLMFYLYHVKDIGLQQNSELDQVDIDIEVG